jgi:hypothetical protein
MASPSTSSDGASECGATSGSEAATDRETVRRLGAVLDAWSRTREGDAPVAALAPHTFPDVLVLHAADTGWLCEIETHRVFVGRLQIEPGTTVPTEGMRGPLTIAAFAVDGIREKIARRAPRP